MQTVHPKQAAALITRIVAEIADALTSHGELNRRPTDVSPQPCDHIDETFRVNDTLATSENSSAAPWYVNYSPYTMMFIGYVDARMPLGFADVAVRLGDHVTRLGWHVRESVLAPGPGEDARLVVESPTPGYGARIVDVPIASAPLRIGIFAASPCLQHPDATTT